MARHFRGRDVALRFIEYMDVGATNGWRMDEVLPSARGRRRIAEEFALRAAAGVGTAARPRERWRYAEPGVAGEIGTISSVTQAFCSDCNRARLSTEGKLFLCLFASRGHDLRALRARRRERRRDRRRDRPGLAAARRPLLRAARRARGRAPAAARRASRCTTSAGERRRHDPTARRGRPGRLQAAARRDARARIPRRSPPMPRARRQGAGRLPAPARPRAARRRPVRARRLARQAPARRDRLRARGAPEGAPHRPRHRHDGPARGARPGIGALLLEACIGEARRRRPRDADPHRHRRERRRRAPLRAARLRRLRQPARARSRSPAATTTSCTWRWSSDQRRAQRRRYTTLRRVASRFQVSTTLSGLSEIETMPSSASQSAKSGWSLGPWPQMPMYLPVARQAAMAREISALTAGIALVEIAREQLEAGVAVEAERQLRQVVRADRHAVEVVEEAARRGSRCSAPRTS